jgi:signal transduction histidine kinase
MLAFIFQKINAQKCALISSKSEIISIKPYISIWEESEVLVDFKTAYSKYKNGEFEAYDQTKEQASLKPQWIHFQLKNEDINSHKLKISLAFVDKADYYFVVDSKLEHIESGDLMSPSQRSIDVGQMCFVGFELPAQKMTDCLLRIESKTDISLQFRDIALRSIQVYTEKPFKDHFITSRIYQAAFYGAIIVMLLYNFFIYVVTRSSSYLYYVIFLLFLIVFMSSNSGFMAELVLDKYPRTDLYLRFISAPVLLISFLIFSSHYLETKKYAPSIDNILKGFGIMYLVVLFVMIFWSWELGRKLLIISTPITFSMIFFSTIIVMRKGYTPALYFLIANILLIIGASFFAFERYNFVVQNPFTQYSIQLAVIFQSVFFSVGLADRIKLVQSQITFVQIENERLDKLRETERKILTEEKNLALEESNKVLDAFIYKTAHDIRGPIARLMGLSNLGLMDVKDIKAIGYFSMLKNNSYFLNYLINRLSIAYDIRTRTVTKQEFDLDKLLSDILLELSFQEEYINVRFNIDMNTNLKLNSDIVLVRFILINILDNAMKFKIQKDSNKFDIYLSVQLNDNQLIIRVEENGIGIRVEEIPFLFEMFSKAAGQYKTPGLGLYMAQLSAEKLGGIITLESPSNPTVFKVAIPL